MTDPLVSICCITYNHATYIRECLEGFLMQKTSFSFEVLINDDASTDGTIEILKEYEAKYPDIIKPIIQTENQYSKGIRGINAKYNYPRAKGKYIAMCEGDDYWTEPLKLQKQVDILERNKDYSASAHQFQRLIDGVLEKTNSVNINKNLLTIDDLVFNVPFQTATIVFRKDALIIPSKLSPFFTDTSMFMLLAEQGNIYFINEYMSVYRIHKGGVWSELSILKKIGLREFYQNKRIEHFKGTNLRVAKALEFRLSQDYIQSMALCIQRSEILSALLCFQRSFKYSYGMAQFKKGQSIIKLIWEKVSKKSKGKLFGGSSIIRY